MIKQSRWLIQDPDKTEQILEQLQKQCLLDVTQHEQDTLTFYDDFEWHLWKNGTFVAHNSQGQVLLTQDDHCSVYSNEVNPSFAKDFYHPQLQQALLELIDIRRLLPIAEVETSVRHFAVRNFEDEKKICNLTITRSGYADMWELKSLRGYDKEYRQTLSVVLEAEPESPERHLYQLSLESLGIKPSRYRSKPKCKIAPDLSAADATVKMAKKMWKNVRINEEGISKDWDTEFLHQYRVALRRMRAIFVQMKGFVGESESLWFKDSLGELARTTNRLRDLDVYLEDRHYYLGLLPDNFHLGINELFDHFAKERSREQRKVAQHLRGQVYQNRITEIEETLNACPTAPTEKGEQAILAIAKERILKRYKQIAKDAKKINEHTPDEQVHEVRLDCKKLRYLLEFFGPLFDKEQIKTLIRALKRLQDNLGKFNDYSVQRESLEHYLDRHKVSSNIQAAVHALAGVLFIKQQEERDQVCDKLTAFIADDIRLLVKRLAPTTTSPTPSIKKTETTTETTIGSNQ